MVVLVERGLGRGPFTSLENILCTIVYSSYNTYILHIMNTLSTPIFAFFFRLRRDLCEGAFRRLRPMLAKVRSAALSAIAPGARRTTADVTGIGPCPRETQLQDR